MLAKKFCFIAWLTFMSFLTYSQAVDNMASFRMMQTDKYMRLHYENDYFSKSDRYYTQGVHHEFVSPLFGRYLWNRFLLGTRTGTRLYGIGLEHNAYTPASIESHDILIGDRPFAADFFVKFFSMRNDGFKQKRITSALALGVLGPAASGEEIQYGIHKLIGDTEPQGWEHQIRNTLLLTYDAGIEKNIVHIKDNFLLNGFGNARIGTVNDKLSVGIVLMAGKIHSTTASVFSRIASAGKNRFNFHVYAQPIVNAVFFDATMQGGLFQENPYTLPPGQIQRFTIQGNYGLVIQFRSIYLEYFQSVISKEFEAGSMHKWGGVRIGVNVK